MENDQYRVDPLLSNWGQKKSRLNVSEFSEMDETGLPLHGKKWVPFPPMMGDPVVTS